MATLAWQSEAATLMPHQSVHRDGSYAAPTLVTDGEHVIASFGSFGIYAYTMAGEPVWQKDLGDMEVANAFGEGSSPILHGDTLVLNWDHEGDSLIVALNKSDGEEKWRRQRSTVTSWTTPILVSGEQAHLW